MTNHEIDYARNGSVNLAYKVVGEGPVDVAFVNVWFSNLDLLLEHPDTKRGIADLGRFCRLLLWDRRGSGLSDRLTGPATLEEGTDDLLTVMDAAGFSRPAVLGFNEGATLSIMAAATHPDRFSHLVVYGGFATTTQQPDYPWGQPEDDRRMQIEWLCENWGTEVHAQLMAMPASDKRTLEAVMKIVRSGVSRDVLPSFYENLAHTDVRHVLPTVSTPTLVLHREGDVSIDPANGRYIAEHIPGARFVGLPGVHHIPFLGEWEPLRDELEEFLTGERRWSDTDRVLATILFTDICDSTARAAALGDARWRELLDDHDEIVRGKVAEFSGRLVKTTGDGMLATFDGPQRAIRCAHSLVAALERLDISVRAGLHVGEIELRDNDVGGIAVHLAARVMDTASAGEVLVSSAVPPLVAGSGIRFESKGPHELKGIEGSWELYAVPSHR